MQTDSTQLQTAPPPQTIQKTPSQQELDMYMMQNNPQMWREMQEYRLRERAHDFEGNSLVPIFEMFIPLTLFIVTGIVLIKFFQNRHLERMQIIERGLDPVAYKELYSMPKFKNDLDRGMGALKWGLLGLFVGIGMIVGMIISESYHSEVIEEVIMPASMLIGGSVGLILYYTIASRQRQKNVLRKEIEG